MEHIRNNVLKLYGSLGNFPYNWYVYRNENFIIGLPIGNISSFIIFVDCVGVSWNIMK
jgi:hypothetical protein